MVKPIIKKKKFFSKITRKRLSLARLGIKLSKNTRLKMSIAKRGNKNVRGKKWKLSEKSKIKYRLRVGERSANWKGGITNKNKLIRSSLKFKNWREKVFKRDNYTCQKCKARSGKGKIVVLHPHHKKHFAKYPKLRFVVSNGITLCIRCHREEHKRK